MKRFLKSLLSMVVASWIIGVPLAQSLEYNFATFDVPGSVSDSVRGWSLNNAGKIVGYYEPAPSGSDRGFLKDVTSYSDIIYSESKSTYATGINDENQIIGCYYDSSWVRHGFFLNDGSYTTFDIPFGGRDIWTARINNVLGTDNFGQVVGHYEDDLGNHHGFLLQDGNFTNIDHPSYDNTGPVDINGEGKIVGYCFNSESSTEHVGFIKDGSSYTIITIPDYTSTEVCGINDAGHIVGYAEKDGEYLGFLLVNGNLTNINVPDAFMTVPFDINDHGQILGWYLDSSYGFHNFLATPVPIPGSVLLLGTGLLGLGAMGWRRRGN